MSAWRPVALLACALALACTPPAPPASPSPDPTPATAAWAPVREIVIPLGTQARIDAGEAVDVLSAPIRIKVGEAVRIRNDDTVDHVIGPYYLQAGAALQQTYRAPQTIEYTCFVNPDQSITLVVEEA